jgi:hypothetical protein
MGLIADAADGADGTCPRCTYSDHRAPGPGRAPRRQFIYQNRGGFIERWLMGSLEPSIYVTYLLGRGGHDDESEAVHHWRQSGGPPSR